MQYDAQEDSKVDRVRNGYGSKSVDECEETAYALLISS